MDKTIKDDSSIDTKEKCGYEMIHQEIPLSFKVFKIVIVTTAAANCVTDN